MEQSNLKNILVTGGLGFIGSRYARLIVENGYNVVIIDKVTYASDIRRIDDIIDKVKLYTGDICDREFVEKIVREHKIDTIVNFAADTHVDNAIKDSGPFIHSNYIGVWNLLEIIRKINIRFIQIGTDESYGDIIEGSFRETDKLNPGNPYSACKAAADLLCLSYINTYGLDICITRSSNNYGILQNKEKLIPRMISLAEQEKSLEIYGDGCNVRDWLWVDDNCEAIKLVMEKGRCGEIYNISSGEELSNNEIAQIISKRFGVIVIYIKDRPGHDKRYSINCDKIKNELGWKPKIRFEDGIEMTIRQCQKKYQETNRTK